MAKFEYVERFYKTYKTTPIMMRRALGTAMSIIDHVEQVDFADLTFTAFAICWTNSIRNLSGRLNSRSNWRRSGKTILSSISTISTSRWRRKSGNPYFELLASFMTGSSQFPLPTGTPMCTISTALTWIYSPRWPTISTRIRMTITRMSSVLRQTGN